MKTMIAKKKMRSIRPQCVKRWKENFTQRDTTSGLLVKHIIVFYANDTECISNSMHALQAIHLFTKESSKPRKRTRTKQLPVSLLGSEMNGDMY